MGDEAGENSARFFPGSDQLTCAAAALRFPALHGFSQLTSTYQHIRCYIRYIADFQLMDNIKLV